MVASSVFIDAPEGYQFSSGALAARAGVMVGRWKPEDNGPGRLARDKATAKTSKSLNTEIALMNFQLKNLILVLKAYPKRILGFSREIDQHICVMLE